MDHVIPVIWCEELVKLFLEKYPTNENEPYFTGYFHVCARHGTLLRGESPPHARQGEVLAKGKGVVVRQGLKEARSKALVRRTETA